MSDKDRAPAGHRAVFLDRDDTLLADQGHMYRPEQVVLLPGTLEALLRLQAAGLALVLVSNQSGVGRGWFTPDDVLALQRRMCQLLPGVRFTAFEYCFHRPDAGCACRKPSPLMIRRAAWRHGFDLATSVMVGDKAKDMAAGRAAGCRTVLVSADVAEIQRAGADADHQAPDLVRAADWILGGSPIPLK